MPITDNPNLSNETQGIYEFPLEDFNTGANSEFREFTIRFPAGRGTLDVVGLAPNPPGEECPTEYNATFFSSLRTAGMLGNFCNLCEDFLDDGDSPDCGDLEPVGTVKTHEILSEYCNSTTLLPDYYDPEYWCTRSNIPCEDDDDDSVLEASNLAKPDRSFFFKNHSYSCFCACACMFCLRLLEQLSIFLKLAWQLH